MLSRYSSTEDWLYHCLPFVRSEPWRGDTGVLDVEYRDSEGLDIGCGMGGEVYDLACQLEHTYRM
jgi:hypothetical protein